MSTLTCRTEQFRPQPGARLAVCPSPSSRYSCVVSPDVIRAHMRSPHVYTVLRGGVRVAHVWTCVAPGGPGGSPKFPGRGRHRLTRITPRARSRGGRVMLMDS